MSELTPRLELYKPADDGSEPINVATDINDNLEKLDTVVGFVPSTSVTPPSFVFDGMATYETDTGRAKFRKSGVWSYLVSAGVSYLADLWLGIGQKLGLGTDTPTAVVEAVVSNIGTSPTILKFRQSSDTQPRMQLDSDGIRFGPGGVTATDVRVYRPTANQLAVTGDVSLPGTLAVTGATSLANTTISGTLDLDSNIISDVSVLGNLAVSGIGQLKVARKLSDTVRTSSTAQVDDTELTLTVDANSIYEVRVLLFVTGDPAGDIQIAYNVPTSAQWLRHCFGPGPAATSFTDSAMRVAAANHNVQVQYGLTSTSTYTCIQESGLLITAATAGSLTLRVNQFASNATSSIIRIGSSMVLRKVALA
jgi:hypothetical protein